MEILQILVLLFWLLLSESRIIPERNVFVLLNCTSSSRICEVKFAFKEKDRVKLQDVLLFMDQEERHNLNKRDIFDQSPLLKEIAVAAGGPLFYAIYSSFAKPTKTLHMNTDGFDLGSDKTPLLKMEESLMFERLLENVTGLDRTYLFWDFPGLDPSYLNEEKESNISLSAIIEATGRVQNQRRGNKPSSASNRGRNSNKIPVLSAASYPSLVVAPGGSPPTRKPTAPTKPTPQPKIVDVNSDGDSGSQMSFNDIKSVYSLPPFGESQVCYPDFVTGPLFTRANGITYERGLRWRTFEETPPRGIDNSCNVDSFLSHLAIKVDQCPDFASRFFRISGASPGAKAESGVRLALQTWRSITRDVNIRASDPQSVDLLTKIAYISNTGLPAIHGPNAQYVNLVGNEWQNVFEQLRPSWTLIHQHQCLCKNDDLQQYHQYEYHNPLDAYTPAQLKDLNRPTALFTKRSRRRCSRCGYGFGYTMSLVPATTWFLPFQSILNHAPPSDWPLQLQFDSMDPRIAENRVMFDLGYISLSTDAPYLRNADGTLQRDAQGRPMHDPNNRMLRHHASLHYFGGHWYYYDDMRNNGALMIIADPDSFIRDAVPPLVTESVVYFRRSPPNLADWCLDKSMEDAEDEVD